MLAHRAPAARPHARKALAAAGSDRTLFPDDALAALHELSQGTLREIDRLAGAALRDAARRKKKLVDRDTIVRVGEALAHFD
jgi:general secretion pathway protein A